MLARPRGRIPDRPDEVSQCKSSASGVLAVAVTRAIITESLTSRAAFPQPVSAVQPQLSRRRETSRAGPPRARMPSSIEPAALVADAV